MTDEKQSPKPEAETEVPAKAKRRRFSAKYKARILREAAACKERGELGALLRREGLYSSHLAEWRKQADKGQHDALEPKKRGPAPRVVDARDKRIAELERENARLARRIEQAEVIIDVQKKVSQLLGIVLPTVDEREPDGES
jgi:transposase-like protein